MWHREPPPEREETEDGLIGRLASGVTLLGDGVKTALDLSSLGARLIQHNVLRRDRNAVLPLSARKTALNAPTGAARPGSSIPVHRAPTFCVPIVPSDRHDRRTGVGCGARHQ